ncbi:hypothetical protein J5069_02900 [Candidatus Symbiopectobacterium sp. NZEC127]|uniref:hypothetical protein n=1 Tax=Candidatus Symbiopectobacterium sp. NZEC127 TaxID=2820472 RepID=UPI00222747EB|nr:hypothetical protein [Candidatus Symbiopectobacterium sp. NZEC127]MCW2484839.1 hypothetical protein [Candidatus Symbiopectobacterium sp. NZEC127]
MATIQAPSMRDAVYQGPQGNLSIAESRVTLNAAEVGDVVELLDMPIGMRIHGVDVISDALGVDVTVAINSGDQSLVAAASHAAAVAKSVPVVPYSTVADGEKITATIAGGAATGSLIVLFKYTAVGY